MPESYDMREPRGCVNTGLHVDQLRIREQESGETEYSIFRTDVVQVPTLVWLKQI
jgi:hypothetical protein